MKTEKVEFTTSDGIKIAGIYTPGSLSYGAVLVHARPEKKESWNEYAAYLSSKGMHTLAIDLRGHGESAGKPYEDLTNQETQDSFYDLIAAAEYLSAKVPEIKLGFIGASIGANLSIKYAADKGAVFVQAISAGIDYFGIKAGEDVMRLPEGLDIVFVSAMDDDRVPGNSNQTETLYNACSSNRKSIKILQGGGHGTQIIAKHPELIQDLGDWAINLVK